MLPIRYAVFVLALSLMPPFADAAKYKAPAAIIATLPPFCGAQYIDGLEDDPRYQIQGCGVYANHYCPALVLMAKVRTEKTKGGKLELLRIAEQEMHYTLRHTIEYPDCMLRPLAEQRLRDIAERRRLLK